MRTEADLRAALAALERHAPAPHAVLGRIERPRHQVRRRAVLVAAAAATVAAIPIGARLLAGDNGPTATARTHPLRLNFTVAPPDGYELGAMRLEPTKQSVRLHRSATEVIIVTVYQAGELDPALIPASDPVRVRGRQGFFVAQPVQGVPLGDPASGVFWEYAPGAWASASNLGMSDERVIALETAEDVRFGEHLPLRVPYRIGGLPAGWRPVSGGRDLAGPDLHDRTSDVTVSTGTAQVTFLTERTEYWRRAHPAATASVGEPVVVAEPVAQVRVDYGSFGLTIAPSDPGATPVEQLLEVARSVTPTPAYADLAAWFDATEVFPAG